MRTKVEISAGRYITETQKFKLVHILFYHIFFFIFTVSLTLEINSLGQGASFTKVLRKSLELFWQLSKISDCGKSLNLPPSRYKRETRKTQACTHFVLTYLSLRSRNDTLLARWGNTLRQKADIADKNFEFWFALAVHIFKMDPIVWNSEMTILRCNTCVIETRCNLLYWWSWLTVSFEICFVSLRRFF